MSHSRLWKNQWVKRGRKREKEKTSNPFRPRKVRHTFDIHLNSSGVCAPHIVAIWPASDPRCLVRRQRRRQKKVFLSARPLPRESRMKNIDRKRFICEIEIRSDGVTWWRWVGSRILLVFIHKTFFHIREKALWARLCVITHPREEQSAEKKVFQSVLQLFSALAFRLLLLFEPQLTLTHSVDLFLLHGRVFFYHLYERRRRATREMMNKFTRSACFRDVINARRIWTIIG